MKGVVRMDKVHSGHCEWSSYLNLTSYHFYLSYKNGSSVCSLSLLKQSKTKKEVCTNRLYLTSARGTRLSPCIGSYVVDIWKATIYQLEGAKLLVILKALLVWFLSVYLSIMLILDSVRRLWDKLIIEKLLNTMVQKCFHI